MSNELILSLGWTLLHSIWQIGLLGLCTLGLERLLRPYSAQARHQLLLFMLGGIVLTCAFTLFQEWRYAVQVEPFISNFKEEANSSNLAILSLKPNPLLQKLAPLPFLWRCKVWIEQHLFWIVALWLLGIVYFSIRFSWNYWSLQGLKKESTVLDSPVFLDNITTIQKSLGLRKRVHFYLHSALPSPLTFGFFRPVVLLPLSLVCQTSPTLLEALLRHELIHIRRADFLTNLLLSAAQNLFFYHPIIWILTRRIQELREEACDEAVLQSGYDKLIYAEALIHLQKLHHHQNIPLVMQAQNHPSHFAKRIRQILEHPFTVSTHPSAQFWSTAVPVILLLLLVGFGSFKPTGVAKTPSEIPKLQPRSVEYAQSSLTTSKPQNNLPKPEKTKALPTEKEYLELIPTVKTDSLPQKTNDMVLSVAAERMNVLYMGIDNPISVAIAGVPSDQVKVSSLNARLSSVGKGKYIARVGTPGKAIILVEAPNYRQEVEFRVKPIPDPLAVLPNSLQKDGEISLSKARALTNIDLFIPVDFETGCTVMGFSFIYIPRQNNPVQLPNPGGLFTPTSLNLIQAVDVNDIIFFDNIRIKCPGDEASRKINTMSFKIIADPEKKE